VWKEQWPKSEFGTGKSLAEENEPQRVEKGGEDLFLQITRTEA